MRLSLASLALIGAVLAVPAVAQSYAPTPPDTKSVDSEAAYRATNVTIAGGAAYLPDYEGSNDYRFSPAPAAIGSIHNFAFSLIGNRFSLDLIPNKPGPVWDFQLGPVAVLNFNRTTLSDIDDPRVRALGKRGHAIEVGGYVGLGKTGVITSPYDKLSVSVSYRHDVNGVHSSDIWQPSFNYLTPLSHKAAVGIFGSAERAGQGYADAYFTVNPAGSIASGLPVYYARSGWKDYSLGALATVSLTGNLLHGFKLVGGGTYSRELNSFGDSPVVSIAGSRNQWLGALGIAYTF